MLSKGWIAAVTLAAVTISLPSFAQPFELCSAEGDGTFTPKFNVEPSLVARSDAVLEATFADLGLEGDPAELAFSFRRTIEAILKSAKVDSSPAAQEAFLKTLLDSLTPVAGLRLNASAGIQMPLDGRNEQSKLDPAKLLNGNSDQTMKPLALFNRFDLAPENWSHCGEHRIVYGKVNGDGDRFLLIFEASVPNPGTGAAGCRPIAEFWAKLSDQALSDNDRAKRLSAFFYEGKTTPSLATPDLQPVVDFKNYGGDGNRGQVRANMFVQGPWQLREWLTQRTFDPNPAHPQLAFVPVTVKDNPLAELYRDSLVGTPVANNNPQASLNLIHGQFVQALTSSVGPRLLSETTLKHRELVNDIPKFNLGGSAVSQETILLNTIALGTEDKFNEFQSTSQGFEDAPGQPTGSSTLITALLDQVGASAVPFAEGQSGTVLLNRARAATCAGCHMTASRSAGGGFQRPGVVVLDKTSGQDLEWPDTLDFVHVDENRMLSPSLAEAFLPFRRFVLSRYLCTSNAVPEVAAGEPHESDSQALNIEAVSRVVGPTLVQKAVNGSHFIGEMINEFAANAGVVGEVPVSAEGGLNRDEDRVNKIIARMPESDLEVLREKASDAIALARKIELQRPGAFVETRRPH